jgi:hypothetical protein
MRAGSVRELAASGGGRYSRGMRLRRGRRGRGGRGRGGGRGRLLGLAVVLVAIVVWAGHEAMEPGPWQRVFATREGLTGRRLACGEIIQPGALFVALPHRSALHRSVEIRYRERVAVVPVLDVGPWNTDDAYWSAGERPAAERGRGTFRKPANPSGIDLSDAVFAGLGLRDNDYLEWRFVHRGYVPLPRLAACPVDGAPALAARR